ncbi:MAG: hypothetical protein WC554_02050 [Clostridia bacterium]
MKNAIRYKSSLENISKYKIFEYRRRDKNKGRDYNIDDYITVEWIKEKIKENPQCSLCKCELLLCRYPKNDGQQFSVQRINNKLAHIKKNCCIICWKCNHIAKRGKYDKIKK